MRPRLIFRFIHQRAHRRAPLRSIRLLVLPLMALLIGACSLSYHPMSISSLHNQPATASATETIPPYTPLPTLTPSRTLLPPPTFEPPTLTPIPTQVPTETPPPTINIDVQIPGLNGLDTPTPTATYVCAPRKDWTGTYTVQPNDYLFQIAQHYGLTVGDIAAANCLHNINILSVGQTLKVPGSGDASGIECVPWEVLTPLDNTLAVPGSGQLTFNWRGPRAPRNLIRVYKPDGGTYERVIELRQNETIDLSDIPEAGTYHWYVYPLDSNFVQISCHEGGPWTFTKEQAPTPTPTSAQPSGGAP